MMGGAGEAVMIRVGKATAGLTLLASGAALLANWIADADIAGYAKQAWPLVLIVLGLESLWVNFKYRNEVRQTRLDVGSVLASVLVAAAVVAYTKYGWPPSKWF